jgi:hypothetical protein
VCKPSPKSSKVSFGSDEKADQVIKDYWASNETALTLRIPDEGTLSAGKHLEALLINS